MFKKRSISKKGLRTKTNDNEDDDGNDEDDTVIIKATTTKGTAGIQSKSTNYESKINNDTSSSSVTTVFESSRELVSQSYSGDATHTSEIDTAEDRDARAILERNITLNNNGTLESGDKIYRGKAAYNSFTKKDMSVVGANKFTGTQGPVRAPTFMRSSTRFDYAPDICKDYKETGFCGFGDQCKFLHDRGDYKSGWQLEKEWDAQQLKKKKKLEDSVTSFVRVDNDDDEVANDVDEDEVNYEITSDDEMPFACHICRESFTNPVMTMCLHYFCATCIHESNKKSSKCPICDKQTFGVFNKATKLIKKLNIENKTNEEIIVKPKKSTGSWSAVDDS